MNEPKIISEKTVLKAGLFDVHKLKLVLPNGAKRMHYIAERVPIVSVFPLTDKHEVYLITQYRYLIKKVVLEAVAGHVDKNETTLLAAKRELKEEGGITANQWEELARIETGASVFRSKAHLFLAKGLEIGTPEPLEGENIKLIKMSIKEALEKVISGEINHAATMIGIFILDKLYGEKKL